MELVLYYDGLDYEELPRRSRYGITYDQQAGEDSYELLRASVMPRIQPKASEFLGKIPYEIRWDELDQKICLLVPTGTSSGPTKKAFAKFKAWVENLAIDDIKLLADDPVERDERIRHLVNNAQH